MLQLYRTVKLGDKEHFDKKHIGVKELFTDYQPFYTVRNVPTYMVIGTYLQVNYYLKNISTYNLHIY